MMYKEQRALFLKVLTPLHAGSGTDLCAVDLPIQREVHTEFPKIEASTLKGCLRRSFGKSEKLDEIFGKEGDSELSAAAISITDARLLFFPVRAAKGVFALITCPMILKRFQEDIALVGIGDISSKLPVSNNALICAGSNVVFKKDNLNNKILIDEYQYEAKENKEFSSLCENIQKIVGLKDEISKKAVLVPDDDFKYFVTHATSIVTRIKVGNDGVVENQALFTEEYLPEESILYSLVMMRESELMKTFKDGLPQYFQIGADETLGKGFVEVSLKGH